MLFTSIRPYTQLRCYLWPAKFLFAPEKHPLLTQQYQIIIIDILLSRIINLDTPIENYYSFIETSIFTKQITNIDENSINLLTAIQNDLLEDPFRGDIVQGTHGARKARIADPKSNKGKSGSYRYLYLYLEHKGRIYLLFLYGKKDQSNLTPQQTQTVASLVQQIKGDNEQ